MRTEEFMSLLARRLEHLADCLRDESYLGRPDWADRQARAAVLDDVALEIREALADSGDDAAEEDLT